MTASTLSCPCNHEIAHRPGCLSGAGHPAGFAAHERVSALRKLAAFVRAEAWFEDVEGRARRRFWSPQGGDPALQTLDAEISALSASVYQAWLYFDVLLDSGERLAERFLAARGRELDAGEQAYLQAALASRMDLFEVSAVAPGGSVALRSVLADAPLVMSAPWPAQPGEPRPGDLWAARILSPAPRLSPRGLLSIDGEPLAIPPFARDPLVAVLRCARPDDALRFAQSLPPLLHHVWLQPVLHPVIPRIAAQRPAR